MSQKCPHFVRRISIFVYEASTDTHTHTLTQHQVWSDEEEILPELPHTLTQSTHYQHTKPQMEDGEILRQNDPFHQSFSFTSSFFPLLDSIIHSLYLPLSLSLSRPPSFLSPPPTPWVYPVQPRRLCTLCWLSVRVHVSPQVRRCSRSFFLHGADKCRVPLPGERVASLANKQF